MQALSAGGASIRSPRCPAAAAGAAGTSHSLAHVKSRAKARPLQGKQLTGEVGERLRAVYLTHGQPDKQVHMCMCACPLHMRRKETR
jgi:hypothetical protein